MLWPEWFTELYGTFENRMVDQKLHKDMTHYQAKAYGLNPNRGGGLNQPALFSDGYFSMKKGVI